MTRSGPFEWIDTKKRDGILELPGKQLGSGAADMIPVSKTICSLALPTVILSLVSAVAQAQAAEIKVLSTGIFRAVYPSVVQQFEQASGNKVVLTIETPFSLRDKLINGAETDVVVAPSPVMKDIEAAGKIVPDSRSAIGETSIVVVLRDGASAPDLSSPGTVKQSIRKAKAVAINDPSTGSNVGRFIMGLADKFAFDDELRSRFKMYRGGGDQVANAVVNGEADFGITLSSEALTAKGAKIGGRLPPEMNQINIAYGFLVPEAKEPDAGRAFIAFLHTPQVATLMSESGIEPK